MGYVFKRNRIWWVKYSQNGKPIRESSRSARKSDAERLLKLREGAIAKGEPLSLRVERVTVDELMDDVISDYEANGKSVGRVRLSTRMLKRFFGGMRASSVTTAHVNAYITKRRGMTTRRGGPPSDASINRELSLLKRGYRLAKHSTPPKVHQVPYIPLLRENNAREGFIEREDYRALKAALPSYLKPVLTTGYFTGMRLGELLSLRWSQVDLNHRSIRLEASDTKNRTARTIPLAEELYQALAELKAQRDWQRPHCKVVFVRDGQPIKGFKKAWQTACVEVGLGKKEKQDGKVVYKGLLFHDLRRSAIRNLVRSGVPERVAMQISGHKTRSVFDRYNIVSESDLEQAARSLDAFHASVGTNSGTIERAEAILKEAQGDK
ncbi:site-specific integrase [Nitrospinae bacterium AH_259_B05_G02_I21]|nr:site-specific integrase [Nitrospinae bacterium AH_259_B05_G02_I21]MDA2932137.1 site-specific integrase [Nitrospinae bacterium AH-259-F20]